MAERGARHPGKRHPADAVTACSAPVGGGTGTNALEPSRSKAERETAIAELQGHDERLAPSPLAAKRGEGA
jgi:hypothetical protein